MPRKPMPWFRFYVEAFPDRKIRRLTPAQRWLWAAIMGAARQSPVPGELMIAEGVPMNRAELADWADVKLKEVTSGLPLMVELGMISIEGDLIKVTNFHARQYPSDNVTSRTRAHRERVGTMLERSNNGRRNAPEVETETETEAELNQQGGQRTETLAATDATKPPQDPTRCTAHAGVADPGPCRGCQRERERIERRAERASEQIRREAERAAIDCTRCDGTWIVDDQQRPTRRRCDHRRTA